jgi:hypothetical protein
MTTVGDARSMGDLAPGGAVAFASAEDARNLRALLEDRGGQAMPVTLAMPAEAEADVEGHGQGLSLALTLLVGDDDTEGHAISVNFPTAEAAARFRRNLVLTGALAGSIVLGSAGAVVITSQLSAPADNAPLIRTPVYERPAGHGVLEGVDPFSSVSTDAAAPAFVISVIDRGYPAGVDGGITEASNESVTNEPVNRQPGRGPLEGVDD